jgi:glycerol-3-phosphate dehydrogenase subunit C
VERLWSVTTTYDPKDPRYLDEAAVREELTRVFDLCHGCQLCTKFCSAFPTLFAAIDRHDDQHAANLTQAEQDQVNDECLQCKLCYMNCPYIPGQSDWNVDFPRLMLRADAMRHATGQVSRRSRVTERFLGRTDLLGRIGTATSGLTNAVIAKRGGLSRRVIEVTVGVASQRLLPPYAKQRFSTWFRKRVRTRIERPQGKVAIFPTCFVEYQSPAIGQDLVKVYERNRIDCSVVDGARCCGAPYLHSGDAETFTKNAKTNVEALAAAVRSGHDIVVPQPTCSYVLKNDYLDYVGGSDAKLVAANTYDVCEYLMRMHQDEGTSLDTEFLGDVPATITYHTPCHLRAQNIGLKSRDLMKLTGARIQLAQSCSGVDGTWGLRAENYAIAKGIGGKLGAEIDRLGGEVVAGDCHLANGAITEETGRVPLHPIQVVARAYGI